VDISTAHSSDVSDAHVRPRQRVKQQQQQQHVTQPTPVYASKSEQAMQEKELAFQQSLAAGVVRACAHWCARDLTCRADSAAARRRIPA
jgi:hypothetical protein